MCFIWCKIINLRNWYGLYTLSFKTESEIEVAQSCPTLCNPCDPWTVAHQAPPSVGFSRQEYWSGLPFASPGYLPDPGIEPRSPTLQVDALTSAPPGKPLFCVLRSLQIFSFLATATHLQPRPRCRRVLCSPRPWEHLIFENLLRMAFLSWVRWYLNLVLIFISLIITDVQYLSTGFLPPTMWVQLTPWSWLRGSQPCCEFFSGDLPRGTSWGQVSFPAPRS